MFIFFTHSILALCTHRYVSIQLLLLDKSGRHRKLDSSAAVLKQKFEGLHHYKSFTGRCSPDKKYLLAGVLM